MYFNKRQKRKEEEWSRVVAGNNSIRAYLMPKVLSSEGGRGVVGQKSTERRSPTGDTEEEERSSCDETNPAEKVRAKLCGGRAGSKVSNTVSSNNLCIDRVEEGVWVADPGIITRDTAVCETDDGVVGRVVHRRVGWNKDDISPCTDQREIHVGVKNLLKGTDTNDSVLASREFLKTGPDRIQYHR